MFDNELMSDVYFTCKESRRIFHAHKYVLATSSAVLFAMFYGEIPPKKFSIRIKDAEEESFKESLRFLYADDCKITAQNAIGVFYLAKNYLITSLAEKCCEILELIIKPKHFLLCWNKQYSFMKKNWKKSPGILFPRKLRNA